MWTAATVNVSDHITIRQVSPKAPRMAVIRVGGGGHGDLHVHLGEPVSERPDLGQDGFPHVGRSPAPAEDTALLVPGDDLKTEHLSRPARTQR
jgi:hypothetical protein